MNGFELLEQRDRLKDEVYKLKKIIHLISAMCGMQDPAEACRKIIAVCKEALDE